MTTKIVAVNMREVAKLFDMRADYVDGAVYGSGHINDTYCVSFDQAGLQGIRYIFLRINTRVFTRPGRQAWLGNSSLRWRGQPIAAWIRAL